MLLGLVISFFVTAVLYASVGFGGGSTYNALLVLSGADYRILPTIALACNIIVVSGGALRFWKQDLLPFRALSPFLVASVPAALIGGRINVSETLFVGLLGAALLLAGLRLATQREISSRAVPVASTPVAVSTSLFFGGAIGLVSGLSLIHI